MKKSIIILLGCVLLSLCVLMSSCDKKCDCEYVISNYNYTISEWEETDRYYIEGERNEGGVCADATILSTTVYDTTSIRINLYGIEDTTYEVEPGVFIHVHPPMSNGLWDFPEDTIYYTELISGYKEKVDCPTWGGAVIS